MRRYFGYDGGFIEREHMYVKMKGLIRSNWSKVIYSIPKHAKFWRVYVCIRILVIKVKTTETARSLYLTKKGRR